MLLELRGVRSGYGQAPVLHGVSVSVGEGEIVALLGPNGAGKTTLLRAASGMVPTWEGEVTLAGTRLNGLAPEARAVRGLAHVPEGRGVLGTLSVEENLLLGASSRREQSELAADRRRMLEIFPQLQGHLRSRASSLSGGQQQMLALARALLGRPRVVMLDEPSFGLAPALLAEFLRLVLQLRDAGTAFLLVEQNVQALDIADRAYVLTKGRVVAEADPSQLSDPRELLKAYFGQHD